MPEKSGGAAEHGRVSFNRTAVRIHHLPVFIGRFPEVPVNVQARGIDIAADLHFQAVDDQVVGHPRGIKTGNAREQTPRQEQQKKKRAGQLFFRECPLSITTPLS